MMIKIFLDNFQGIFYGIRWLLMWPKLHHLWESFTLLVTNVFRHVAFYCKSCCHHHHINHIHCSSHVSRECQFFKVGQKDLADWVLADTVNSEPDKLTFDLWPFTQNPVNHRQHAFRLIYNWIPTSVSMPSSLPLNKTIYRVWGQ